MECAISSLLGGLGDDDLLGMTDKNQVGVRMSSATFNSSQKLYSCLPSWHNVLNDKTLLQKLSHSVRSYTWALSFRFIFSVNFIEATISCAGWVLHQLAVCAAWGEALKRMVSTRGCGWIREMGSAESCCVVWPLMGWEWTVGASWLTRWQSRAGEGDGTQLVSQTTRWPILQEQEGKRWSSNTGQQCWSFTFYLLCPYSHTFCVRNLYLLLILDTVLHIIVQFFVVFFFQNLRLRRKK